jgi:U3 small nucleolar RNA-associated protein 4
LFSDPAGITIFSLQPLLFMDLLDERTLVAVERPLDDIIAQLPPPIKKKKFGT